MNERHILLVEDNPDDEALTIRAFQKNSIRNEVVVAHDGAEALDYLLAIEIFWLLVAEPPPGGISPPEPSHARPTAS
jgi:CheY-like chemotaxis protein